MSRRLRVQGRRWACGVVSIALLATVAVGDSTPGTPGTAPLEPKLHELESLPDPGSSSPGSFGPGSELPGGQPMPADPFDEPTSVSGSPVVQDDPGTLTSYRGRTGQSFLFRVTGNAHAGSVYGSGVYTDDSTLAAAVVHHGVLKDGDTGVVRVTMLPGQSNYDAATRHGVTSYAYGSWVGSYRVTRASDRLLAWKLAEFHDPGNLTGFARQLGESFVFRVTGTTDGYVWGTDVYTSDSDLSTAAVHAGLVQPGQTALVRATILPGRSDYGSTTRNGVTSRSYSAWGRSYRLSAVPDRRDTFADHDDGQVRDDPGNLTVFHRAVDDTLLFRITGSTDGLVWGSGPYTSDSDLSTAAVHAGLLQPGETGVVKVTIQPVQFGFPGSERHGVTTREFLPWDGNYRIERVTIGGDEPGGFSSGGISIIR